MGALRDGEKSLYTQEEFEYLRTFFNKTEFRFGYKTRRSPNDVYFGIAYAKGYGTAFCFEIFVNFSKKRVQYHYSPALSCGDKYALESFENIKDIELPKTEDEFWERIRQFEQIKEGR